MSEAYERERYDIVPFLNLPRPPCPPVVSQTNIARGGLKDRTTPA